MNILKARFDGFARPENIFSNAIGIEVLVDKLPEQSSLRYQRKGGLFWAESEGYVHFLYHRDPRIRDHGFGGREFKLTLVDNSTITLRGPWSSNPSAMNAAGFPHCIDVSITDREDDWNRGYTFLAGNLLVTTVVRHVLPILTVPEAFNGSWKPVLLRHPDGEYEVEYTWMLSKGIGLPTYVDACPDRDGVLPPNYYREAAGVQVLDASSEQRRIVRG